MPLDWSLTEQYLGRERQPGGWAAAIRADRSIVRSQVSRIGETNCTFGRKPLRSPFGFNSLTLLALYQLLEQVYDCAGSVARLPRCLLP